MNPRETGFLLLTSTLGDTNRRPLSVAQFRNLTLRARSMEKPLSDRELTPQDLIALGYPSEQAQRIVKLLADEEVLNWYLQKGSRSNCHPLTRISEAFPDKLRQILGADCPGSIWVKGDLSLLYEPAVALVGSRDLNPDNLQFACEVGKQTALQGFVLVSGNARGADKAAQDSCLQYGGKVISIVADSLESQPLHPNMLYISEEGFDLPFTAARALQRNRLIHCLGQKVFVAQSTYGRGGTWDGTTKNLRFGWNPVFCYDDGSKAAKELFQMGAELINTEQLSNIGALTSRISNFMA